MPRRDTTTFFSARSARAVAALCLVVLSACAGDGGTIHIGVAVPHGTAGGRAVENAVKMAVAEANERGGIGGRRVELVFKDDGGKPDQAIQVASELRGDPRVVAVIGHVNSAATLAAAAIYNDEAEGVVELSPTASNPDITHAGPWTFRVSPSDLAYGPELAHWLAGKRNLRRAAVLYGNDDYGRGVAESFGEAFRKDGGTVVAADPYLPEMLAGPDGARVYLARALGRGMDALVIAGTADDARRIIASARELGYRGPVVGADGLLGIEAMGAAAEGTYIGAAFFADAPAEPVRRFVEDYTRRFGEQPNADAALGYDATRVVLRALAEGGTNRRAVRDYLAGIGSRTAAFQGVTGDIRFDANGDPADKAVAIGVVRGGQVVAAGS